MKTLILMTALIFATSAMASEKTIYKTWNLNAELSAQYQINPELGRAWVELEIDDSPSDPDWEPEEKRIKIEGLSYNAETKEIIFTDESERETVCAVVKKKGRTIFRTTRIYKRKACKFKIGYITKMVDDGFYVKKKKYKIMKFTLSE